MKAVVKRVALGRRTVCISDIHGHLDLFLTLLEKVRYTPDDTLILLGDLYLKGPRPRDTLRHIVGLSRSPNVHILRGNCEDAEDWMTPAEQDWVDALPHIIDGGEFVFAHGGPPSEDWENLDAWACMKNNNFLETGPAFSRWVVVGHYPTFNYCHRIPCHNPIADREKRIIAIDGGCQIKAHGQLNAFVIEDGAFAFEAADALPSVRIETAQAERGGTLNIVWDDRLVEMVVQGEEFSTVRHVATGQTIELPTAYIFREAGGRLSGCSFGTDYYLPVAAGETVSVADTFSDRILAKKNGTVGWIKI